MVIFVTNKKSSMPSNAGIEQRDGVHEMLHFWKKETSKAKVEAAFTEKMLPVLFRDEIVSLPYNFKPLIANPIYRMAGVFVDYEKLMRLGIPGLKAEIAEYREKSIVSGGDYQLYDGMLMALDVFINCCRHYEKQAVEKASEATDIKREKELYELARVLRNNALYKPESFYEALQLSWLYTLICGSLELGRVDVYLGDFYVNDIDNGIITEEEALSLMQGDYWRTWTPQRSQCRPLRFVGARNHADIRACHFASDYIAFLRRNES